MPSTILAANALTSYEAIKCELGLADGKQPIIERLINAVSDQFEAAAGGRSFYYQTGIIENHRGLGDSRLISRKAPLVTVTSIILRSIQGDAVTTYDASSYYIEDAEDGFVFRGGDAVGITQGVGGFGAGFPWTAQSGQGIRGGPIPGTERKAIELTYDAGYVTEPQQENTRTSGTPLTRNLPYDIEQAVIDSVVSNFRRRGRNPGILSKTTAEVSVAFSNDVPGLNSSFLTPQAISIAESYARPLTVSG